MHSKIEWNVKIRSKNILNYAKYYIQMNNNSSIQTTEGKNKMWRKKHYMTIFHFTRWLTRMCNLWNINCSSILHFCAKNNAASSTIQCSKRCWVDLIYFDCDLVASSLTSYFWFVFFFCSIGNNKKFFCFYVQFLFLSLALNICISLLLPIKVSFVIISIRFLWYEIASSINILMCAWMFERVLLFVLLEIWFHALNVIVIFSSFLNKVNSKVSTNWRHNVVDLLFEIFLSIPSTFAHLSSPSTKKRQTNKRSKIRR